MSDHGDPLHFGVDSTKKTWLYWPFAELLLRPLRRVVSKDFVCSHVYAQLVIEVIVILLVRITDVIVIVNYRLDPCLEALLNWSLREKIRIQLEWLQ